MDRRQVRPPGERRRTRGMGHEQRRWLQLLLTLAGLRRTVTACAVSCALQLSYLQAADRTLQLSTGRRLHLAGEAAARQQRLRPFARLFGPCLVNFRAALGVVRQDRHDVVVDLQEAAGDEDALIHTVLAHPQLAERERR